MDEWTESFVKLDWDGSYKLTVLNNNSFKISYAVVKALIMHKLLASTRPGSGTPMPVTNSQLFIQVYE